MSFQRSVRWCSVSPTTSVVSFSHLLTIAFYKKDSFKKGGFTCFMLQNKIVISAYFSHITKTPFKNPTDFRTMSPDVLKSDSFGVLAYSDTCYQSATSEVSLWYELLSDKGAAYVGNEASALNLEKSHCFYLLSDFSQRGCLG